MHESEEAFLLRTWCPPTTYTALTGGRFLPDHNLISLLVATTNTLHLVGLEENIPETALVHISNDLCLHARVTALATLKDSTTPATPTVPAAIPSPDLGLALLEDGTLIVVRYHHPDRRLHVFHTMQTLQWVPEDPAAFLATGNEYIAVVSAAGRRCLISKRRTSQSAPPPTLQRENTHRACPFDFAKVAAPIEDYYHLFGTLDPNELPISALRSLMEDASHVDWSSETMHPCKVLDVVIDGGNGVQGARESLCIIYRRSGKSAEIYHAPCEDIYNGDPVTLGETVTKHVQEASLFVWPGVPGVQIFADIEQTSPQGHFQRYEPHVFVLQLNRFVFSPTFRRSYRAVLESTTTTTPSTAVRENATSPPCHYAILAARDGNLYRSSWSCRDVVAEHHRPFGYQSRLEAKAQFAGRLLGKAQAMAAFAGHGDAPNRLVCLMEDGALVLMEAIADSVPPTQPPTKDTASASDGAAMLDGAAPCDKQYVETACLEGTGELVSACLVSAPDLGKSSLRVMGIRSHVNALRYDAKTHESYMSSESSVKCLIEMQERVREEERSASPSRMMEEDIEDGRSRAFTFKRPTLYGRRDQIPGALVRISRHCVPDTLFRSDQGVAEGTTAMWSLQDDPGDLHHAAVLLSAIGGTRLLRTSTSVFEDITEQTGVLSGSETLAAGNLKCRDWVAQITPTSVRGFRLGGAGNAAATGENNTKDILTWSPSGGVDSAVSYPATTSTISLGAVSGGCVIVQVPEAAARSHKLVAIGLVPCANTQCTCADVANETMEFKELASLKLPSEASCISRLVEIPSTRGEEGGAATTHVFAVGTHAASALLVAVSLPTYDEARRFGDSMQVHAAGSRVDTVNDPPSTRITMHVVAEVPLSAPLSDLPSRVTRRPSAADRASVNETIPSATRAGNASDAAMVDPGSLIPCSALLTYLQTNEDNGTHLDSGNDGSLLPATRLYLLVATRNGDIHHLTLYPITEKESGAGHTADLESQHAGSFTGWAIHHAAQPRCSRQGTLPPTLFSLPALPRLAPQYDALAISDRISLMRYTPTHIDAANTALDNGTRTARRKNNAARSMSLASCLEQLPLELPEMAAAVPLVLRIADQQQQNNRSVAVFAQLALLACTSDGALVLTSLEAHHRSRVLTCPLTYTPTAIAGGNSLCPGYAAVAGYDKSMPRTVNGSDTVPRPPTLWVELFEEATGAIVSRHLHARQLSASSLHPLASYKITCLAVLPASHRHTERIPRLAPGPTEYAHTVGEARLGSAADAAAATGSAERSVRRRTGDEHPAVNLPFDAALRDNNVDNNNNNNNSAAADPSSSCIMNSSETERASKIAANVTPSCWVVAGCDIERLMLPEIEHALLLFNCPLPSGEDAAGAPSDMKVLGQSFVNGRPLAMTATVSTRCEHADGGDEDPPPGFRAPIIYAGIGRQLVELRLPRTCDHESLGSLEKPFTAFPAGGHFYKGEVDAVATASAANDRIAVAVRGAGAVMYQLGDENSRERVPPLRCVPDDRARNVVGAAFFDESMDRPDLWQLRDAESLNREASVILDGGGGIRFRLDSRCARQGEGNQQEWLGDLSSPAMAEVNLGDAGARTMGPMFARTKEERVVAGMCFAMTRGGHVAEAGRVNLQGSLGLLFDALLFKALLRAATSEDFQRRRWIDGFEMRTERFAGVANADSKSVPSRIFRHPPRDAYVKWPRGYSEWEDISEDEEEQDEEGLDFIIEEGSGYRTILFGSETDGHGIADVDTTPPLSPKSDADTASGTLRGEGYARSSSWSSEVPVLDGEAVRCLMGLSRAQQVAVLRHALRATGLKLHRDLCNEHDSVLDAWMGDICYALEALTLI